ncbi:hypothetical protein LCGC14_3024260 [marine sediment metagenome]|uniref:Uncharacterized protein n=1 Tax=marine sediment metagenome TaxID=412755 RepID=A0A0F8ZKI8_9ZZZZ
MTIHQKAFMCPVCGSRLIQYTQGWYPSTAMDGGHSKYSCTNTSCSWRGYIEEIPPKIIYDLIKFPGVTTEEGVHVKHITEDE